MRNSGPQQWGVYTQVCENALIDPNHEKNSLAAHNFVNLFTIHSSELLTNIKNGHIVLFYRY